MTQTFGAWVTGFLDFFWSSFLLLAPMLLLGLFLAGLIHVLISREAILRWLKDDSLKSVGASAAIGVPMPLCSCSVVPVVAEMRKKGASRSSCMSFLITAPETGADSILVTQAFFGFVPAVMRPVISFVTAVVCGIFCIGLIRDDAGKAVPSEGGEPQDHDHHHHHDHDHDHDHSHSPLIPGADDCYVKPSHIKAMMFDWFRKLADGYSRRRGTLWVKPDFYRENYDAAQSDESDLPPGALRNAPDFKTIVKHIFRYGFVDVADDILFALLVGVALGGLLYLAIPTDLMSNEYARWISYPVMVLVGVPLYICASASTPIAAALVAKGFSPGAALIFLMTGPATNTGTIAIIVNQFGARFASVYVAGVIAVTVVIGILIDLLLLFAGLSLSVNLEASDSPALMIIQWGGAFGLIALIVWRFRAGALKSGYADMMSNLRPFSDPWKQAWRRVTGGRPLVGMVHPRTPLGRAFLGVLVVAFLGSGFKVVPPDSVGYARLFGKVVERDLPPGLHYMVPRPFGRIDAWPVKEVKSLTNAQPFEYLAGDLNLLAMTLNVQYRVNDAYVYHYLTQEPESIIMQAVRDQLRGYVAIHSLDDLLNILRAPIEQDVTELFAEPAARGGPPVLEAIDLVAVSLTSLNPVAESMNAFREISSSQEDRERYATNAQRYMAMLVPRAFGNAAYEREQAEGEAYRRTVGAAAEADAIVLISRAVNEAPQVLRNMLWREKLETALAEKHKVIVPNQQSLEKIALWKGSSENGAAGDHR